MKLLLSLAALSLVSASVIPFQGTTRSLDFRNRIALNEIATARSSTDAHSSVEATSDYSKRLETDYDYSKRAAEAGSDYDNGKRTSSDYRDATDYDKRDDSDYNLGDYVKRVIEDKRGAAGEDTDYGKRAGSDYDSDYEKRTGKAAGDYEPDYSV